MANNWRPDGWEEIKHRILMDVTEDYTPETKLERGADAMYEPAYEKGRKDERELSQEEIVKLKGEVEIWRRQSAYHEVAYHLKQNPEEIPYHSSQLDYLLNNVRREMFADKQLLINRARETAFDDGRRRGRRELLEALRKEGIKISHPCNGLVLTSTAIPLIFKESGPGTLVFILDK